MTKRIRNRLSVLMLLMSVFCLSGCSYGDEPDDDNQPWDGGLSLVLDVGVVEPGSFPTRALNDDSYFEQPTLSEEKLRSLRVIIVDTKNDLVAHNELHSFTDPGLRISGLRFKVEFSTQYKIFLIANESGLPEEVVTLLSNTAKPGSEGVISLLENCILDARVLVDNTGNEDHHPIPMSEVYDVTTVASPNSNLENVKVEMKKSFFVTRAASKFSFRFLKKDGYTLEDNNLSIQSIKIFGLGNKEFLFPMSTTYDPAKDVESASAGREITDFGVPAASETVDFTFVPQFPINIRNLTETGTLYSPLYYFPESRGVDGKLSCSISYDGETYLPPVELPNLPHALPRNTHVIVNVTVGDEGALLFEVVVEPWEPRYHEVDFSNNVAMAEDGTLTFVEGTYASLDKATGRLVLNDYPQAVTGRFGISSPINAKWYAYLVTTSGEQNAIQFQVTGADGKTTTSSSISGIIDGKLVDFKVVATQSAGQETRSAVLQVIVTMADGLSVPVNILKSTEYGEGIEHITFIQNRQ